jgi:serine/threonine protein kinase
MRAPSQHTPALSPLPAALQDPKDRDRVDRECRVMRNLSNHTTVARLYEYVETQDHVYLMMEEAARG